MISPLQRTKHLDRHLALLLRHRAKVITAHLKRIGLPDSCKDAKRMRTASVLFTDHQPTEVIYDFFWEGDTAWRDEVPRFVWDVLLENHNIEKAE